ncbi:hypothetical protein [Kineococcus sp. SYSU DK005]|uniref:hypothetical protein n=1 Tax=Kineococcus sp. SYSU DK005 TaxID=3383126 RepID=UPI003D7D108E
MTPEHVHAAAVHVGLPLDEERAQAVAELLSQWLPAAEQLNERMRAQAMAEVAPITVFASA